MSISRPLIRLIVMSLLPDLRFAIRSLAKAKGLTVTVHHRLAPACLPVPAAGPRANVMTSV